MSAGSKLSILLVAVLLAFGLAACGGDDDSASTATDSGATDRPDASQDDRGQGGAQSGGEDSGSASGDGEDGGGSEGAENDASDRVESKDFVPRPHADSGGGSQKYVTPGGDNSVQEFGAEAGETDRDAAATAVHNFLDARAQEAWAAACSYLSSEVRKSLETFAVQAREAAEQQDKSTPQDTGCPTILAELTNKAALPELRKEAAEADVRSLRVEGDRAFIIYTNGEGTAIAIPVVKEDGDWRVGSLAGTPIVY
jgi:hypothetical protein